MRPAKNLIILRKYLKAIITGPLSISGHLLSKLYVALFFKPSPAFDFLDGPEIREAAEYLHQLIKENKLKDASALDVFMRKKEKELFSFVDGYLDEEDKQAKAFIVIGLRNKIDNHLSLSGHIPDQDIVPLRMEKNVPESIAHSIRPVAEKKQLSAATTHLVNDAEEKPAPYHQEMPAEQPAQKPGAMRHDKSRRMRSTLATYRKSSPRRTQKQKGRVK